MNDTLAHICVALVALALALWLAGHLLPKRHEEAPEETPAVPEDPWDNFHATEAFVPRGPSIVDQEREWRAPHGRRRL